MIELANEPKEVLAGNDNVVIMKYLDGLEGGRCLDVTDYKTTTGTTIIPAGTLVVNNSGTWKPVALTSVSDPKSSNIGDKFSCAADITAFDGVVVATIDASHDGAAVMIAGKVNFKAMPFVSKVTKAKLNGIKFNIVFSEDNE